MSDETKNKREASISYRPPQELRDEFHRRVQLSGLSLSCFITSAVFGQEAVRSRRKPPIERRDLVLLLAKCAAIHDQLSRFDTEVADSADIQTILGEARLELAELRAACFKALGRTP